MVDGVAVGRAAEGDVLAGGDGRPPAAGAGHPLVRRVLDAADALAAGELARGRSALVITHRLVGMEVMDEILVLDAGRVVERGTHEELARAGGLYKRLLDAQYALLAEAGV
jgi:ABC-type Na+ transport system ATPase subunit NatA